MRLYTAHISECVCKLIPVGRMTSDTVALGSKKSTIVLVGLTVCLVIIRGCIKFQDAKYAAHVRELSAM